MNEILDIHKDNLIDQSHRCKGVKFQYCDLNQIENFMISLYIYL